MTGTKNRQKSILMICCLLAVSMLAGCGAKPTDESSNALTESNATISASELVVAGNEIAIGVDPTVYPAADYLLNMGAGEILFKADANGVIQPYLPKMFHNLMNIHGRSNCIPMPRSGAATRPMQKP